MDPIKNLLNLKEVNLLFLMKKTTTQNLIHSLKIEISLLYLSIKTLKPISVLFKRIEMC